MLIIKLDLRAYEMNEGWSVMYKGTVVTSMMLWKTGVEQKKKSMISHSMHVREIRVFKWMQGS